MSIVLRNAGSARGEIMACGILLFLFHGSECMNYLHDKSHLILSGAEMGPNRVLSDRLKRKEQKTLNCKTVFRGAVGS